MKDWGSTELKSLKTATLEEKIAQHFEMLEQTFVDYSAPVIFDEFKRELIKLSADQGLIREKIFEWNAIHVMGDQPQAHLYPLYISLAFAISVEIAHEKGRHEQAWSLMCDAQYRLGQVTGLPLADFEQVKTHYAKKEFSSRGGRAKADKRSGPAKKEAIRLLKALAPTGGWKSEKEAISTIHDSLFTFIEKQNNKIDDHMALDSGETEKFLTGWLQDDENVRAAFESSRAK